MPKHWQPPDRLVLRLPFHLLCLVSVSRPSLEYHWESKESPELWEKHRKTVCNRLHNTNLLGGLLLSASAVFLSTPPALPSLLPYTATPSYVLTLASFAHALGGALVGGIVIFVYESCDREWAHEARVGFIYSIVILITNSRPSHQLAPDYMQPYFSSLGPDYPSSSPSFA
ncbi:hypothetical protein F5I97DRAFT_1924700 [Phlebopus sp. FC_14]|nr:hypothetical protein F5I97DRAFT_1924700 [Phlebopus sp. FC_14]